MSWLLHLILFFLLKNLHCSTNAQVNHGKLVSVVAVFRHGDRTPVNVYPNDPYKEYWGNTLGQLTNQGKQRLYALGLWYRKRYDGFLSKNYNSSEIQVYSTDSERTLMSAGANLAGLFPPVGDQIWNDKINWQPVPIHKADDSFFRAFPLCDKFMELREDFLQNDGLTSSLLRGSRPFLNELSHRTGENISDITSALLLYDTLYVENHNNLLLPEWTFNVFPERLHHYHDLWFLSFVSSPEILRLFAGSFLQNVIDHFEKNINGETEPKFLMYAAHDYNLLGILSSLDLYPKELPYYGSTIIFELRENSDGHVIYTYFKDRDDISLLKPKKCSVQCKFDNFKNMFSNITLTAKQFSQDCNVSNKKQS